MAMIYQRAKEVIVWLGPPTVDSSIALSVLEATGGSRNKLAKFEERYQEPVGPQFEPFYGIGLPVEARQVRHREFMETLSLKEPSDIDGAGWMALENFLMPSPWWKRLNFQTKSNGHIASDGPKCLC